MAITALKCPNCAAPVPASRARTVVCAYCGHVLTSVPRVDVADASERPEDEGRPRVAVGDARFVVEGRLGVGDGCDVFLARRDARLTERVVLKVLRAGRDADLVTREWRTLEAITASEAQGADYFRTLLPQAVTHGRLVGPGAAEVPVNVYRWRSGFVHTLEDVRARYPDGVDPRAAVWMWKRLLEGLGWVHRAGYVHGAVVPRHLLLHARDHGVVLVGWSSAARSGSPLAALSAGARGFYPDDAWAGRAVTPATDLTMGARSIVAALNGDPARGTIPRDVPEPLAELLKAHVDPSARGRSDDAWELMKRVSEAGKRAFGPARFVPFAMPGW